MFSNLLTCHGKEKATYSGTLSFRDVLIVALDGVPRGRERGAGLFQTCP